LIEHRAKIIIGTRWSHCCLPSPGLIYLQHTLVLIVCPALLWMVTAFTSKARCRHCRLLGHIILIAIIGANYLTLHAVAGDNPEGWSWLECPLIVACLVVLPGLITVADCSAFINRSVGCIIFGNHPSHNLLQRLPILFRKAQSGSGTLQVVVFIYCFVSDIHIVERNQWSGARKRTKTPTTSLVTVGGGSG
jgi:hypothetical protein